ncbi:MAG: hypothetical protein HQK49_10095 [Oligoflexia bacterium]|nr:hypothetical protein [Oligoflexia bacterium]
MLKILLLTTMVATLSFVTFAKTSKDRGVSIIKNSGEQITNFQEKIILKDGDIVKTTKNTRAQLYFPSGDSIILFNSSKLKVLNLNTDPAINKRSAFFYLSQGAIQVILDKNNQSYNKIDSDTGPDPDRFEIKTQNSFTRVIFSSNSNEIDKKIEQTSFIIKVSDGGKKSEIFNLQGEIYTQQINEETNFAMKKIIVPVMSKIEILSSVNPNKPSRISEPNPIAFNEAIFLPPLIDNDKNTKNTKRSETEINNQLMLSFASRDIASSKRQDENNPSYISELNSNREIERRPMEIIGITDRRREVNSNNNGSGNGNISARINFSL